jgi:hypothetical protein
MRLHPVNIDLALGSVAMLFFKFLTLVRNEWFTSVDESTFHFQNLLRDSEKCTLRGFMVLAPELLSRYNGHC